MQLDKVFLDGVGLASSFVAVMLLVVMGAIVVLYFKSRRIQKLESKSDHSLLKMSFLIISWSLFFSVYFFARYFGARLWVFDLPFFILEVCVFFAFIYCLRCFWRFFDRFYLVVAGVVAFAVLLFYLLFLTLGNIYFYYLSSVLIPFSPLLGLVMIIKFIASKTK